MLSNSAVVNSVSSLRPGTAARHAPGTSYSSGRYTHIRKRFDRTPVGARPVTQSALPERASPLNGEEQSLQRMLLDEVESLNRLYRVVSQAGCEILFYGESGELAGRYGKSRLEALHLAEPVRRAPGPASPLASPIFNADGSCVGFLELASAGDCTGTVAAMMQMLVRSTVHAVEERAFRKRHAGEWIVALALPDEADSGLLLAVDRHHRVIGADRRARTSLLQGDGADATAFWSLFEKNSTAFGSPNSGDRPVTLTRLGGGETWPALVTPPLAERSRTSAQLDQHARPRLDIVGCSAAQPDAGSARGGLTPRALRRVRDHIDAHLTENVTLEALAEIAGLSRCHFARAFKQSVGTAPHAYLLQRRLERAERLLKESDVSLCQVALDSGFSDQSHFSSCFRRHFGESPRSFRRSQQ
jgi:AraC-like DNA-binding protein